MSQSYSYKVEDISQERLMASMMENKRRIEERELALAGCMASKKNLETGLNAAKEALVLVRGAAVVDVAEVRKLTSDIAKWTRDLASEQTYEKEKFEEIRILKMKHYDLQQQFAQKQMGKRIFKFPPMEQS